jgi:dUTP pyrophosphatase
VRKFEKVSRFKDVDLPIPTRATTNSAGYDFIVAEDIVVPPIDFSLSRIRDNVPESRLKDYFGFNNPITLSEMAEITKGNKAKVTLVSTGMKCYLNPGEYLELSVRSSTPLKHWLVCANSVGIIDQDYADNPDNEGEIYFQIINLGPFAIQLKRGDRIGQGIIKNYLTVDDDDADGERLGGFGSTNE